MKEYAEEQKHFNEDVLALFKEFDTNDFELILRLVWHATIINQKLNVRDRKTRRAYRNVRKALIKTVRDLHSSYSDIKSELPKLYSFTKEFRTIISLNYDLIMYWIIMYGENERDRHKFKDCFINGKFRRDWYELRTKLNERENTLVFYPHGNLCLARNIVDDEVKLITNGDRNLLDMILKSWTDKDVIPLFISEGTTEKKLKSIESSSYLSIVYHEVLPRILFPYLKDDDDSDNLVIYGWSLGEHDEHIFKQIINPFSSRKSGVRRNNESNKIAISVYELTQEKCFEYYQKIKKIIDEDLEIQIYFFDSADAGCWNNPE